MAAIEAQHLNVAYVAVAKSLGLPTQAYMALSDGKFLDAQAGGETFSSALLAALAGVNSVSGPGMLDFVLTFSLPKLVFDNEVCGQCLHFVRDMNVIEDLPATAAGGRPAGERSPDHVAAHAEPLAAGAVPDGPGDRPREPRDLGEGRLEGPVPARLRRGRESPAAYTPIETDAAVDAEMRRMIVAGMTAEAPLPELPPPPEGGPRETLRARRPNRRRASFLTRLRTTARPTVNHGTALCAGAGLAFVPTCIQHIRGSGPCRVLLVH